MRGNATHKPVRLLCTQIRSESPESQELEPCNPSIRESGYPLGRRFSGDCHVDMAWDDCSSRSKSALRPAAGAFSSDGDIQAEEGQADLVARIAASDGVQITLQGRWEASATGASHCSDDAGCCSASIVAAAARHQTSTEQAPPCGPEPGASIGRLRNHTATSSSMHERNRSLKEQGEGAPLRVQGNTSGPGWLPQRSLQTQSASPGSDDELPALTQRTSQSQSAPLGSDHEPTALSLRSQLPGPLLGLQALVLSGTGRGGNEQSRGGPRSMRQCLRLSENIKKVYLICFRGTTFEAPEYKDEPALIKAGHLGFAFEDDPDLIFGFHPTPEAIAMAGGEDAAVERLSQCMPLDGALQSDRAFFVRAHELCRAGARTAVWQVAIELPLVEYFKARSQALHWLFKGTAFPYCFPGRGKCFSLPLDRDNCATFPRRLALPIPDASGQLARCMSVMQARGERWTPEVPWAHGRWNEV